MMLQWTSTTLVAGWLAATGVAPTFAAAGEACLETVSRANVSDVVDARSLRLADGRTIRLAGIEPFGLLTSDPERMETELLKRLTELVGGRDLAIQIVATAPDRYGRFSAMAAIEGELLQETVVEEGLAIAFGGSDALPCFDRIIAAENEAREKHRGFWTGELPQARPEALASWIGRFVIFEGKIISVGNRRSRTYLNFGFRWTEDVTAEIAAEDRELFGGEAVLDALAGQRIRVRGFLEEKGGPMVVLRSPTQLEVLSDGVPDSGKAP
jgi:endonuclease YncB( thermonuclease family)